MLLSFWIYFWMNILIIIKPLEKSTSQLHKQCYYRFYPQNKKKYLIYEKNGEMRKIRKMRKLIGKYQENSRLIDEKKENEENEAFFPLDFYFASSYIMAIVFLDLLMYDDDNRNPNSVTRNFPCFPLFRLPAQNFPSNFLDFPYFWIFIVGGRQKILKVIYSQQRVLKMIKFYGCRSFYTVLYYSYVSFSF